MITEERKKLFIVGAGGFGRELVQVVDDVNRQKEEWSIQGFLDDNMKALDGISSRYRILGSVNDWVVKDDQWFALAIANTKSKENVVKIIKSKGGKFASIVHPFSTISSETEIGEGLIVYAYSGIGPNTRIGNFVSVLSSTIGHDAVIDDYCTLCSHSNIAGGVKMEKSVFVSVGATIIPGRKIREDAFIGAGSVVLTHVRKGKKMLGNPAKILDY